MIGIDVAKSTVEKHMVRRRKPPSPTWIAILSSYLGYYHGWRVHQSLEMDAPDGRLV